MTRTQSRVRDLQVSIRGATCERAHAPELYTAQPVVWTGPGAQ